jgi:hypothetical protein
VRYRGSKKATLLFMLQASDVDVYVAPRVDGVTVAPELRDDAAFILRVPADPRTGGLPPDVTVDDDGIGGILTADGAASPYRAPWHAVFGMYGQDGLGVLWEQDEPAAIAARRVDALTMQRHAWGVAVDALAALDVRRLAVSPDYRVSARAWLHGRWVGCVVAPASPSAPVAMDLAIEAGDAYGLVGRGVDAAAPCAFQGIVDEENGTALFDLRHTDTGLRIRHLGLFDGAALRGVRATAGAPPRLFVLSRAAALDDETVESLATSARRRPSGAASIVAAITAPLRIATRATHRQLLAAFWSLPVVEHALARLDPGYGQTVRAPEERLLAGDLAAQGFAPPRTG